MANRELILREMGLTPIWRLRSRANAAHSEAPASTDAAAEDVVKLPRSSDSASRTEISIPLPEAGDSDQSARRAAIMGMQWDELKLAVQDCTACGLCKSRRQTVFGVGDESANWMIIGEAPGAEEDARGEPFVGPAGKLLDNMLHALQLERGKNVYIANVLKCRPPSNRNPEPDEVARCEPHLSRQIELVQPKLILAMGRFAAQTLLDSAASIASMRGKLHAYQGIPVIVSYHPAYLLRNLPDKAKSWADLQFARRTMQGL